MKQPVNRTAEVSASSEASPIPSGGGLRGLGYVRRPAPGALFDEHSMSWKLVSRWSVLAGGAAAVLLQVAHPSVGAGVNQHSSYATDPLGRLERTLTSMLAISFGSPEQREAVLAELRRLHRPVTGTRDDGESYRALDPELQMWVWATLIHVGLAVERRYEHRLTEAERRTYYLESRTLAAQFRIPDHMIPADLDAFEDYMADTISSLEVTDDARQICREIIRPELPWTTPKMFAPLEWLTVELLDDRLREDYGLSPLSPARSALMRQMKGTTRWLLPKLPDRVMANPLNKRAFG